VYNVEIAHLTLTTPVSGKIFRRQGETCYDEINVQNLKSLGSPITKLSMAVQNAENGVVRGHSRSAAMSQFDRAHRLSIRLTEDITMLCPPKRPPF